MSLADAPTAKNSADDDRRARGEKTIIQRFAALLHEGVGRPWRPRVKLEGATAHEQRERRGQ
jgi:hypothetical protein